MKLWGWGGKWQAETLISICEYTSLRDGEFTFARAAVSASILFVSALARISISCSSVALRIASCFATLSSCFRRLSSWKHTDIFTDW